MRFNRPPTRDRDVVDISDAKFEAGQLEDSIETAVETNVDKLAMDRKARKRKRQRENKEAGMEAAAAASALAAKERNGPKVKRLPGESDAAFNSRKRAVLKKHRKTLNKKLVTTNQRDRRRKHAQEKKAKVVAKRQQQVHTEESRPKPATFGDVVQRPPILSSAAMKSRSKLKEMRSSADSAPSASNLSSDLADYASKVRDAYAAIKKRRFGDFAMM